MAKQQDPKIWKEALRTICGAKSSKVTAAWLAVEIYTAPGKAERNPQDVLTRNHSAAGQLLRRLRQWGYLRPAGQIYTPGGGRPQIVYEPTEKALRKVAKA